MDNKPFEKKEFIIGSAEIGTFAGTLTGPDGKTVKKISDDIAVNSKLNTPKQWDNAALLGGVKISVILDVTYNPKIVNDNRVRSSEFTVRTDYEMMEPGVIRSTDNSPKS